VVSNIGIVMSGIDPQTRKYVGAEAVLKEQIAAVKECPLWRLKCKRDQMLVKLPINFKCADIICNFALAPDISLAHRVCTRTYG
jgi:hypothetical protein